MDVYQFTSYRTFLKAVWDTKKRERSSYSLRMLARHLGMDAGHLSLTLKGTKGLSQLKAFQAAEKLGLSEKEREYFLTLVQYEHAASQELRSVLLD